MKEAREGKTEGVGVKHLLLRRGSIADRVHDRTFACFGGDQSSEVAKALRKRGWTDVGYVALVHSGIKSAILRTYRDYVIVWAGTGAKAL